MPKLTAILTPTLAHGGRVIFLVLSRTVGFALVGMAFNGALFFFLLQGITVGKALTLFPLLLVAGVAYVGLGYRFGLMSAARRLWQSIGDPLLQTVADQAAAVLIASPGLKGQSVATIADTLKRVREGLPGQGWLAGKAIALLTDRIPFAEVVQDADFRSQLEDSSDEAALAALIRRQLDRFEVPDPDFTLLWLLLVLNGAGFALWVWLH